MTDADATFGGPIHEGGSSIASAGSNEEASPEDVAKRRSKNRVNARRSRERKRLLMDTLQQEHWKLHQENKRIILENEKLRQTIAAVKLLRAKGTPMPCDGKGAPPADTKLPSGIAQQGTANVPSHNCGEGSSNTGTNMQQTNVAAANPLMSMLLQQLLLQQQAIGVTSVAMNPIMMQLLMAQALHPQNQIVQGGFNPLLNALGGVGVGFNPFMNAPRPMGGTTLSQTAQPGNLQQDGATSLGDTTAQGPQPHKPLTKKDESTNATKMKDTGTIESKSDAGGTPNLAAI